jgi:hypothetical protein
MEQHMTDEIKETIEQNAAGPKRVKGDSGEIEQHSLKDQIEADRYLRSKEAVSKGLGLRITKMKPSGA